MTGTKIKELPTPALIIDLDIMERNLKRAAQLVIGEGKKIRPHIKTHKIPEFARLQIELGATGICVAKVSEAEVMADGGIEDILIANQIVGSDKLLRMARLAARVKLTVLVDSFEGLDMIADTAKRESLDLGVMVEVETGDNRCGARPEKAYELAKKVVQCDNLRFAGLETFGGSIFHGQDAENIVKRANSVVDILMELKNRLEKDGVPVPEISIGGSPALNVLAPIDGPTELRPGVYIFNDTASVYRGAASFEDCAATVLTSIISKPAFNRAVIDGGAKTFSYCTPRKVYGRDIYYGVVKDDETLNLTKHAEEHGILESEKGFEQYRLGDKIEVIPTHACPVINLFDKAYCCRNGKVEAVMPILARGKTE